MRDPYASLGVERGAGKAEIKAAYRFLVKRWHPDRHGDNAAARERFVEISEAYAQLTRSGGTPKAADGPRDARPRRSRKKPLRPRQPRQPVQDAGPSDEEMMERIFGVAPPRVTLDDAPALEPDIAAGVDGGEPKAPEPRETPAEAEAAANMVPAPRRQMMRMALAALFARRGGSGHETVEEAKGADRSAATVCSARVPLDVILNGGTVDVDTGEGMAHGVAVASGTADGTVVAVPGEAGGRTIHVVVRHAHSDMLWANGADVHAVRAIDLETAVLGGSALFTTLDGTIRVKVPAWSGSDKVLKVAGRGLPTPDGARGDLFIHLRILLDAAPDAGLIDLIRARRNGLFV